MKTKVFTHKDLERLVEKLSRFERRLLAGLEEPAVQPPVFLKALSPQERRRYRSLKWAKATEKLAEEMNTFVISSMERRAAETTLYGTNKYGTVEIVIDSLKAGKLRSGDTIVLGTPPLFS